VCPEEVLVGVGPGVVVDEDAVFEALRAQRYSRPKEVWAWLASGIRWPYPSMPCARNHSSRALPSKTAPSTSSSTSICSISSVSQKSSVTRTTNSRSVSNPCSRAFSRYSRMHSYSRIVGTTTQTSWCALITNTVD